MITRWGRCGGWWVCRRKRNEDVREEGRETKGTRGLTYAKRSAETHKPHNIEAMRKCLAKRERSVRRRERGPDH